MKYFPKKETIMKVKFNLQLKRKKINFNFKIG